MRSELRTCTIHFETDIRCSSAIPQMKQRRSHHRSPCGSRKNLDTKARSTDNAEEEEPACRTIASLPLFSCSSLRLASFMSLFPGDFFTASQNGCIQLYRPGCAALISSQQRRQGGRRVVREPAPETLPNSLTCGLHLRFRQEVRSQEVSTQDFFLSFRTM